MWLCRAGLELWTGCLKIRIHEGTKGTIFFVFSFAQNVQGRGGDANARCEAGPSCPAHRCAAYRLSLRAGCSCC